MQDKYVEIRLVSITLLQQIFPRSFVFSTKPLFYVSINENLHLKINPFQNNLILLFFFFLSFFQGVTFLTMKLNSNIQIKTIFNYEQIIIYSNNDTMQRNQRSILSFQMSHFKKE